MSLHWPKHRSDSIHNNHCQIWQSQVEISLMLMKNNIQWKGTKQINAYVTTYISHPYLTHNYLTDRIKRLLHTYRHRNTAARDAFSAYLGSWWFIIFKSKCIVFFETQAGIRLLGIFFCEKESLFSDVDCDVYFLFNSSCINSFVPNSRLRVQALN